MNIFILTKQCIVCRPRRPQCNSIGQQYGSPFWGKIYEYWICL